MPGKGSKARQGEMRAMVPAKPDPVGEPCDCCDEGCACGDCPECMRERPRL